MATNETEKNALVRCLVVEALPNTMFRVSLDDGQEIIAYLSGKMRMNRIKVLVGDKVEILPDPYGGKARIVRRL
ncbi:translation initiation factor IF-1 [Candidatus Nomurabacteria bacterium]|nr:translation initiation factor IF-1 [Candidatus Nomurabacteria bacterium]MCB9820683.1 translation initiation factor IF-1 [Candidatus Nomurabacteria bacterium]